MKISKETVEAMRDLIAPLDTEETRNRYRKGLFPRADRVKNLDMRYRWDLYHAARAREALLMDGEYPRDITSDHIDTALRRVVQPLGTE